MPPKRHKAQEGKDEGAPPGHQVIEACLSSSAGNESGYMWNPHNGLTFHTFGGMKAGTRTLDYSTRHHTVYTAHADKAMATIHYASKEQPRTRCSLPEKLSALAVSPTNDMVAAGSPAGKLYLWHIASGNLLKMWEGHYKTVSRVAFTTDGTFVVSASEDATVKTWNLGHVLDVTLPSNTEYRTHYTYQGHTLGVVDLAVPKTDGWVVSAGKDRTVKVHDFYTGCEVYCCVLPAAPKCLACDVAGTMVFCGCKDGKVYQADLYPERTVKAGTLEDGSIDNLHTALLGHPSVNKTATGSSGQLGRYHTHVFDAHKGSVTAIALSTDSQLLLTGGEDGSIHVWQVASRQLLRSFTEHKGPITTLAVVFIPAKMPSEKESTQCSPFAPLKRAAITGDGPDDYAYMAYHQPAASPVSVKRMRMDASSTAQSEALSPPPVLREEEPVNPTSKGGQLTADLVNRLYMVVMEQQKRLEMLEKKS